MQASIKVLFTFKIERTLMSIRILGLRPYKDKKTGKIKKSEKFKEQGWVADSVPKMLENYDTLLETITEKERYNLFFTFAHSLNNDRKQFEKQDVIVFDVDGVEPNRWQEYKEVISEAIESPFEETGWISTGNGFHIIVGLDYTIESTEFYDENRVYYKAICTKINLALKSFGLPGEADADYFKYTNMIRLPGTINNKTPETGYPTKNSVKNVKCLQRIISPQEAWYLHEKAGIEYVPDQEQITSEQLDRYPAPDTKSVMQECEFIRWCIDNPADVKEDAWYKLLSIVPRLEYGNELAHEISSGHPGYNPEETDAYIQKALVSSGPRTCKNIEQSFPGCKDCKHYNKVKSPIRIVGPDHIATERTGFRKVSLDANGNPKTGKPDYDDLLKHFKKNHKFIAHKKVVYIWVDTHWKMIDDDYIDCFCEKNIKPAPVNSECEEFRKKVFRNNRVEEQFFTDTIFRKINLKNGILDLSGDSPELIPHSVKYGFLSTLPYGYEPEAKCERFDTFLHEVTVGRKELTDILLEFAGYSFANMDCQLAKALILLGDGANGKSTFMELLQKLAGREAYSAIPLSKLDNDQYAAMLHGKLFNITEETPDKAFRDSSIFKNLVSGGVYTAKIVYKQPMTLSNRAKFITACNEMPESKDVTYGMLRRLIIVPFDADFRGVKQDVTIKDKLESELTGVLNRVIEGYYRLKKQGDFTEATAVDKEKETFISDNNHLIEFKDSKLLIDTSDAESTMEDLFNEYLAFCESYGYPLRIRLNRIHFSRKLAKVIPEGPKRRMRKRVKGKNTTIFIGVKILTDREF